MYAVSLNFKRKDQMKIIIMAVRVDEGFLVFHINIVVSCMDHEKEMGKTTNQHERGLGLTLKGSSSPNVWIVFTPKKARNYPTKNQMKMPMDLQIIQNQRSN